MDNLSSELKLIGAAGIANTGTYIAIPFLSVYLLHRVGLAPWQIGTIMTVILVSGRLFPTMTGTFGDRYGHHINIGLGIFVRGIGFLLMGTLHTFPMLIISGVFIGLGGALYDPSVSALLSQSGTRNRAFVWLNIAQNAGTVIGPLLGIWISSIVARGPFLEAGILLIGFGLLAGTTLLRNRGFSANLVKRRRSAKNVLQVVSSRKFLIFNGLMVLFWIDFSQLTVSIPLRAFHVTDSQSLVGTINITNGIVGMVTAFLVKNLFDRVALKLWLALGFLVQAIAFFLIPLSRSVVWMLFCVLVYTIGETVILPASDLAITEFAKSGETGLYFGVSQLSWAIGGSIGNFLGVTVAQKSSYLPWTIYSCLALLGFMAFIFQHFRGVLYNARHSSQGG